MNASAFSKRLFWFIVGINFLNYLDRYTLPAVLEPLGRDLALNDSQRGWLGSAFLLSYMVASPVIGMLADRFCRPKIIAVAIALWSLATSLTWFVSSYNELLLLRALVGIGEAAYYSLGVAMLCDIIPEKERAGKLNFFFLAIPVGSAVGFGLSGVIAQHFGWRMSFLLTGLPGLLFAMGMWFVRDPLRGANDLIKDTTAAMSALEKLRFLFTHRIWLVSTACYVAYTFAMGAMTHWSASFLERVHGVSTGSAGLMFGAMAAITGIVGTFAGGFYTQKMQSKWPNIEAYFSSVTLCIGAIGVAGFLLLPTLPAIVVSLTIGLVFLFANTTPVNNLTVSQLPASVRAWGVAINVFLIHLFGDAISPEIVGSISDRAGGDGAALGRALLITPPAFALSGIILLLARRKRISNATGVGVAEAG
jgi:MFS family permease